MSDPSSSGGGGGPAAVLDMPPPGELIEEIGQLETLPRADPAAAGRRARLAAERAQALGLPDLRYRADLVVADSLERQGNIAEAGRIALAAQRWATEHSARYVLARSHYVLAAVSTNLGDDALALEHSVRAVDLLDDGVGVTLRVDHLVRLADTVGMSGDGAGARARYPEVLRLTEDLGDVERQLLVLNNWSYSETLAGEVDEALRLSEELQSVAARHGVPLHLGRLDTVARALIGMGRHAEAEGVLGPGLAPDAQQSTPDGDAVEVGLLTLAEVQRVRGHLEQAQVSVTECLRLATEHGVTGVLVRAHEEQALLFAAMGRWREAYQAHVAFHTEAAELQSAQRDARARTLQTMYETSEARQQSRRFRELSLRDPLTGLYNRRYVDEELPRLLRRGGPLTVALLDLDHFKRINDTCSHEVGDQVLRAVAGLVDGAAITAGTGYESQCFAARMGGEEFLLVLAGQDARAAHGHLEDLRRAVGSHPWAGVTGTLPVTVSIGAASTGADSTEGIAQLLARADEHLYTAKDAGRDRVVTDA